MREMANLDIDHTHYVLPIVDAYTEFVRRCCPGSKMRSDLDMLDR